ncbi:hypothetical protein GCM10010336_52420 [Streptomyces goshikiensis]|nr:hypothetical protein EES37_20070 [Streptomyces sp. ADI91-18]GHD75910.1 hypothetical protein GCM10010336_52420 [Streptomyces goshikiensis]
MLNNCGRRNKRFKVFKGFMSLAIDGTDPTMDRIQVKKDAKPVSDRIPDKHADAGCPTEPE